MLAVLRDDAFEAELAGVPEDGLPDVLIELDVGLGGVPQVMLQPAPALLKGTRFAGRCRPTPGDRRRRGTSGLIFAVQALIPFVHLLGLN
jgi:hypothetical protein